MRNALLERLKNEGFTEDDVRSTSRGASGEDICLSSSVRRRLGGIQIEVKTKQSVIAGRWMEQAASHGPHKPVTFFREMNESRKVQWYGIVTMEHLLDLLLKEEVK